VSDVPDRPNDDPFEGLPPELRAMLEQFGGPDALAAAQEQLAGLLGGAGGLGGLLGATARPEGPVDWSLATRVALQVAAEGDRPPTAAERATAQQAIELAEHWLDASPLPAPPDAGRLVVGSRQEWVNAAVVALRPLVEPVARAGTDALIALAREQLGALGDELGSGGELPAIPGLEGLPPGFEQLLGEMLRGDPGELLRPAGAVIAGLQAGQVVGQLARQLLGAYELGIPTAPRSQAHHLAVNVAETFEGYELDPTQVAIALALHEAALRRLYHAVPWLEAHVQSLVARFAAGTQVDADRLRDLSDELMFGVDPEDPEALRAAMERAAAFRLEPTAEQERVLERLQGVVCLVGAWARHEVGRAVEGRLPGLPRIAEVLRRRRATRGDGEELLAGLLGLDLKPDDEAVGERFVAAVEGALGPAGLRRALDHPENLPDAEELADPARWLARTADDLDVPDDAAELFGTLGDAPHEGTAEERTGERDTDPDGGDPDGHPDPGPDAGRDDDPPA
jgi:putative hydrolase